MELKPKKWSVDLTIKETDVKTKLPCPLGMRRVAALEKDSPTKRSRDQTSETKSSSVALKEKQRAEALIRKKYSAAMSLASSPGRSVLMNAFMMYMSGSNLNMWSISITGMSIMTPIKGIFGMNKQFAKFEDPSGKVELQTPKLIFIALNLFWLAVGLYKMSKMRLLPTTSADWSGRIVWKEIMEVTSIPPL